MKRIIIALAATALAASAFVSCGGSAKLKTEADSLAYAIGVDLGRYIKQTDSTLNLNIIYQAINDVVRKDSSLLSQTQAEAFVREYMLVRKPARTKAEGEAFLADVEKENRNIRKSESGLMYEIFETGDENFKPTDNRDQVRVVYEGRLRNGFVFDSSIKRGDTTTFMLSRVIPGWQEGLKMLGKGGKAKLWIPTDLAYGRQGYHGVPANEPLIFEMTLVDIIPAEKND